jgi:hypothetical protein
VGKIGSADVGWDGWLMLLRDVDSGNLSTEIDTPKEELTGFGVKHHISVTTSRTGQEYQSRQLQQQHLIKCECVCS